MADKQQPQEMEHTNPANESEQKPEDSLESFVREAYQRQKDEGKMDSTSELGEDRTNDFFARALAESRRMNVEVEKSNQKLAKLHNEFGLDLVNAWQTEHASEVLSSHQQELVKQAQYRAPTECPQGDV